MLRWAGQLSTPAVPQGRWSSRLLVVILPHPAPLGYCTLWVRVVRVVNRLTGPLPSGLNMEGGQKKRSSRFHHLQLLLRTWSMGIKWGRGEKTEWTVWEISAAASSHMSNHSSDWTTPLCWYLSLSFCVFLSPCQPNVFCPEKEARGERRKLFLWTHRIKQEKMRDGER